MGTEQECSRCRHWRKESENPNMGECRRYPPQVVWHPVKGEMYGDLYFHFPMVLANQWCGEFCSRHGE